MHIEKLRENTEWCREYSPKAMDDRDGWQEGVNRIRVRLAGLDDDDTFGTRLPN